MQKYLSLALLTSAVISHLPLAAQTVPYSTSSVQGSTIITNYYDPNAGPNVGPGLTVSPLQSRFDTPLSQFGTNPTSAYTTTGVAPIPAAPGYSPSTLPLTTIVPAPLSPLSTFPVATYPPATAAYRPAGPVLLNPAPLSRISTLPSHYEDPTYPYPGLLTMMNGKWIGSSYLYNMPHDIGIVIEVIKPGNKPVEIDTRGIRDDTAALFARENIHPESLAIGEDPPLPFFHILIFVYPDEDKYTAAISGRYFEKVKVSRLDFETPGTSQAITWEKLDLIITSPLQFQTQLSEAVREIVESFLNRVHYFNEERLKQETGFRLQCSGLEKARPKRVSMKNDCCECR